VALKLSRLALSLLWKRKFFVLFFDDTEMSIFSDLLFLKYHDAFLYIIDQPTAG
jgi:hypothetical protein